MTNAEVKRLLSFPKAIELAREAYVKLEQMEALNPQRLPLTVPSGTTFFFMPAHIFGQRTVSIKVARVNPENSTRSLPSVMVTIYVYDSRTGQELAQIEADTLTAVRTAASTAVATDLLAREGAEALGVFGSGVEAAAHIGAIREVRELSQVLVYSRNRERREAFAKGVAAAQGIRTKAVDSPSEVAEKSEIIVTATTSPTPVLNGDLVSLGTHVNAIGASSQGSREIDTTLVKRSRLVVDSRQQALSTYGDIMIPLNEHAIEESHIQAELGELLAHDRIMKWDPNDITLFKSGGLAVLDAMAADFIVSQLAGSNRL